jgi:membrane protease subunit HflC
MKKKSALIFTAIIIIGLALLSSAFIVDETEQVVITQFGKVTGDSKTSPGLYFKIPIIQHANYFPKNLLQWDGDPGQIPTKDKTYIWVDTFARWKIVNPVLFFQTVNNTVRALARLDDIIDPAVRNAVTSYRLIETVRKSNRALDTFEDVDDEDRKKQGSIYNINVGRQKITEIIMSRSTPKLAEFGIELVDVKIKRINYVEEVRKAVYGRMIAERKQIAEKFRSEGLGEASKIRGKKERELQIIESEAYKISQNLKGESDAKATFISAEAYSVAPEFYSFLKSLDVYKEALDSKSSLVISTDSEFLKYLKGYSE